MAETETEYSSVGWWKDDEGNVHQGSILSRGYLAATEKGTGSVPEVESEDEPRDGDEAAELEALKVAAEKAAADKAAAEKAAADKAKQQAGQQSAAPKQPAK